ncbi:MAG: hypothetical protein V1790_13485 [Planctomycetota bacterium]
MAKRNKEKAEVQRMVQIGQICGHVTLLSPAELKQWLKAVPAALRKGPCPDMDLALGMLVKEAKYRQPELLYAMQTILTMHAHDDEDCKVLTAAELDNLTEEEIIKDTLESGPRSFKVCGILKALPNITDAGLNRIRAIIWDDQLQEGDDAPGS